MDPQPLGFAPELWNSPGLIWPLIVITLVVLLTWSEYQDQDCRFDGVNIETQKCLNKAQPILPTDTKEEIIDKIIYSVRKNHNLISWKRALVAAMLASILIFMYYYRNNLPNGFIYLMITLVIFLIIFFPLVWFGAHWFRMNDDKIEEALIAFRNKV